MLKHMLDEPRSEQREEAEARAPLSCPKCGSHDVRRSKGEGVWAALIHMVGRWPFRCRSCRSRFYKFARHLGHD